MIIPERPLAVVQGRVDRLWTPGRATHHLIIGESGSGKTGLMRDGVLPLVAYDRLFLVDLKNDTDEMWADVGRVIGPGDLRPGLGLSAGPRGGGPAGLWYRLAVDPLNDHARAFDAVRYLFTLALGEGHMVIGTDETRGVTETGQGQLGLGIAYEQVLTRGRSFRTSCISAVAATDNLRPAVRNQWTFAWAGAAKGAQVIGDTLRILSLPHTQLVDKRPNPYWPVLRDLVNYEWLYMDRSGRKPHALHMARVTSWAEPQ